MGVRGKKGEGGMAYCSNPLLRPFGGDAWMRGRRRYRYHGLRTSSKSMTVPSGRIKERVHIRAGTNRHMTEPLFPETLHGTVCGS